MAIEVLVVFPQHASFIDQDLDLLRTKFDVDTLEYKRWSDRFELFTRLRRARVAIAWFVLGYGYAMVRLRPITRAKCILVAGGWDVEAVPELGYGEMLSRKRARRTAFALTEADRVLAVSAFTLARVRHWAPKAKADVVYHGFDGGKFFPGEGERQGVLTVARIAPETWRVKGLDTFLEAARRLSDVPFTIVGQSSQSGFQGRTFPPNVRATGHLNQSELIKVYQRSSVYAQLSAVESFGCSLAEAMLCGCVPVVTDRGALPEVAGPVGETVPYGEIDATVQALQRALESREGPSARNRIRGNFPLERRRDQLVREIHALLEG